MNRSKLKSYAPQARKEFIQAVTDRAAYHGLKKTNTEPITQQGDTAVILGRAFPKIVAAQRKMLEERISRESFDQVMEAVAYTWFNRFVAIRYMELHGYLDHGYRVLSHPEGESTPEILERAQHLDLPGLNKEKVVELKLDGTRDEELYRLLLVAQCNALNKAMPFLFERVQDESELLLPDNLLHSNSLIRKLVGEVEAEDWQEVEIIGWIYQFYISEKKDAVIGKVVKSEDIPAATQLFTPNWIVKYLVQNSIGRQWMATYPTSPLKEEMEYHIEPAEQTEEVNAKLSEITPESLNPEEMTLLDPACGSGHILVEAYEIFKAIYQERGYRAKDIPRLILEKNLHGLEIDDRAAQLASFAVLMKAREDDRRILEDGVAVSIFSIQSSDGLDADAVFEALSGEEPEPLPPGEEFDFVEEAKTPLLTQARRQRAAATANVGFSVDDIRILLSLFNGDDAKTFGSLIRIPDRLARRLPEIADRIHRIVHGDDLNRQRLGQRFQPIVAQSATLAALYDAVVVNPPYMGNNYLTPILKKYLREQYKGYEKDFFSAFIDRCICTSKPTGCIGIIAPYVWMFISSYEQLRERIIGETTLTSLIQLEYNAFEPACIPVASFTLTRRHIPSFSGSYVKLSGFRGHQSQAPRTLDAIRNPSCGWFYRARPDDFGRIPGSLIAYWVSTKVIQRFAGPALAERFTTREGMATADNGRFLRAWSEVAHNTIEFQCSSEEDAEASGGTWFPYNKGGEFRRWYGNNDFVVEYKDRGFNIKNNKDPRTGRLRSHNYNGQFGFREGLTWSALTSGLFSIRYSPQGSLFDSKGAKGFSAQLYQILALLNSCLAQRYLSFLSPTLDFKVGDVIQIPLVADSLSVEADVCAKTCVQLARSDWDAYERSWDFQSLHILTASDEPKPSLESSYTAWITQNRETIAEMKRLEEENNRLFIDAYGLADELTPDVHLSQITLTVNPAYRYGGKLTEEEQWTRFRQDTMKELVSYSIGCTMGRYSLDKPGIVYALSGDESFDPNHYKTFPADDDGIIPITYYEWFDDDATNRFVEFISVAWPKEYLKENLTFIAESVGTRRSEQPKDTIRRYLANDFYKDHLQTYKKRPIYWLFTSGKQRAFQALVYLHRYTEGTLARMRTEYVIPLQGKMSARIDHLDEEVASATSTSHGNKLRKEQSKLKKQLVELREFDETLRHYADQRIKIDLDDGVKANYHEFGGLLAEVKTITGRTAE